MEFKLPRGMRDLAPEEYEILEKIRDAFFEASRIFGFKIMEPSPIEFLNTLEAKSGPAISQDIYCFKDKAGRDLGLRFDLTVGMTRFVASRRDLQLPVKLSSFSSMWRYDEPQYGRYRWFYQWDAEIYGLRITEADAEIIEFTNFIFNNLGLKNCVIEIGDRQLVEEYVRREMKNDDEVLVLEAMRALDKMKKKPIHVLIEEYVDKGINEDLMKKIFEFGEIRGKPYEILGKLEELDLKNLENLKLITESLDARDTDNILLSMEIVRGLDYYDGVVFEVFDGDYPDIGALAGGGRFNGLPAIFGRPDLTATGVAGGVERIILALSKRSTAQIEEKGFNLYIAYSNESFLKDATKLVSELRKAGFKAETDLSGRNLRKQMEIASSAKNRFVLIFAPREYSQRKIILKHMIDGSEKLISIDEVTRYLKEINLRI